MATIANLMVKLGVDQKGLKRGFGKALKDGRKFVNNMVASLTKIGLALTASIGAVTGLLLNSINRTAEGIDNLAKTSSKLGIAVDQLQKLQFQAALSGVNANTLNMALQRMTRRVSEAGKGLGEAKDALKELGLDAAALVKLSPDQQFRAIAKAMEKVKSQTDKVRLSFKLFDSEGVALVNTLNSNLDQTSKEFDKLGISLSKQQATAVEAYTDSQTKLSAIWNGFKQQLTAVLAGPLTKLLEKTIAWVKTFGGLEPIARKVAKTIILGAKGMAESIGVVVETVRSLITALREAGELMVPLLRKIGAFVKAGFVGTGTAIGEGIGALQVNANKAAGGNLNQPGFTYRTKAADIVSEDFNIANREQSSALARAVQTRKEAQSRQNKFNNILTGFDNTAKSVGGNAPKQAAAANRPVTAEQIKLQITTDHELFVRRLGTTQGFSEIIGEEITRSTDNAARQVNR